MRQYFRVKTYADTLGSLRQQQWELHRQSDRFLVSAVVRRLPLGYFRAEKYLKGKFREARLDVTGSCSAIASEHVSPVSLTVNEQVFLSESHERIAYGCVAVRVELHCVSDDVRHLVVASVVESLHGVQYSSLHRLQAVHDVWHGTLQVHV